MIDLKQKVWSIRRMALRVVWSWIVFQLSVPVNVVSQTTADSLAGSGSLKDCIRYALAHQPLIHQSLLDEQIAEREISTKLADWYPQLNFAYNLQHNSQLPTSIVQGSPIRLGLPNTSSGQFSLSQTLFNKDVLLASSTAGDVRSQVSQLTSRTKIDVVVGVSKAYYAVLVAEQQIQLFKEDINRLHQSQKDALDQYHAGIVDKIDYQRATIALNNATAQLRQNQELLKARVTFLKDQMGYPQEHTLQLAYDSTEMEREAVFDTTIGLHYESRIEYQLLQTQKRLDEANLDYYEWNFLPAVTAVGSYSLNYQNGAVSQLYNQNYPSSYFGLQVSVPIFEGGKRIQQIKQAQLELERADEDLVSLKNAVGAEYAQALADYKSNLNNYRIQDENLGIARSVYETIQLQYKAGTKTYLDVITAETDLRTALVNRSDALFQVLSSKLDLQKSLGSILYQ